MTENQRVILHDAITTTDYLIDTFDIKDKSTREKEQNELIERIVDDIKTVLRLDKQL